MKDGYNKMVPPVQMAQDRTMIPVTVDVSIVLLKIVEIEEENHAIDFQYEIIMKVLNVTDISKNNFCFSGGTTGWLTII